MQSSSIVARADVALLSLVLTGCSYPAFTFSPNDASPTSDDTGIDTAVNVVTDTASEPPLDTAMDARVDADAAETRTCDPGLSVCGGACVDTRTSAVHCGGCGKACAEGEPCSDSACRPEPSCAAIRARFPALGSGGYTIDPDGSGPLTPFRVFCDIGDGGGWTLALKLDGAKTTFAYDAVLWTNDTLLNTTSIGLSENEAKYRSFLEVPFKQVRLRMVDAAPESIIVDAAATSLKTLFSGGTIATVTGRAKWLSLVASPSLQTHCNAEGFNLDYTATTMGPKIRLRVGIVGNQETDCSSPDSFIGFGAAISDFYCYGGTDPGVVVGNLAGTTCGAPASRYTKAFGFIFVR